MLGIRHPWRIKVLSVGVIAIAIVLVAKLYFVQIVQGADFRNKAEAQYFGPSRAENIDRGSVYFSDNSGNLVSAATIKTGFTLSINPEILDDPETLYDKISQVLTIDRETFLQKAG